MAKYRKKPIEVDAWKVVDLLSVAAGESLPDVVLAAYEKGDVVFAVDEIRVRTLEGVMTGGIEDMIIEGVHGELYPCKPEIFADTYDRVE